MLDEEGKIKIPWDDPEAMKEMMEKANEIMTKLISWQKSHDEEFTKILERSTGVLLSISLAVSELDPIFSVMLNTQPNGTIANMSSYFIAGYTAGKLGLMDSPTVPSAILKAFET